MYTIVLDGSDVSRILPRIWTVVSCPLKTGNDLLPVHLQNTEALKVASEVLCLRAITSGNHPHIDSGTPRPPVIFVVALGSVEHIKEKRPVCVMLLQDGIQLECKLPDPPGNEPWERNG
jgi:hypothetical protein